ncbi:MAG TPA: hypothetical protein VFT45_11460 [Longimicrobium sp.]|nr:hypothetical protein [Longimicrobium sp.]
MLVAASLLILTACAGTQSPSPEPAVVDHPMHTPILVSMMMMEQEAHALQDSAIMRMVRAGVDEWNKGNLDAFLALYDSGAEFVRHDEYVDARDAVRQIHSARQIGDGEGRARLSMRLVTTQTMADDARRLVIAWTATDAAGHQETWTTLPTFRFTPGVGWQIIHERLLPDDEPRDAASPTPGD